MYIFDLYCVVSWDILAELGILKEEGVVHVTSGVALWLE